MNSEIKVQVRCTEIDMMGHVNNSKFLEYMEWCREEWYKKLGIGNENLAKRGLGTAVVNININYRKEVTEGEVLTVRTEPLRRGNKSYILLHRIYNDRGSLVADAQVTSVVIDLEKRKSVELIEEITKVFHNIN